MLSIVWNVPPWSVYALVLYISDHSSRKGHEEVESTLHSPSPSCFILKQVSVLQVGCILSALLSLTPLSLS